MSARFQNMRGAVSSSRAGHRRQRSACLPRNAPNGPIAVVELESSDVGQARRALVVLTAAVDDDVVRAVERSLDAEQIEHVWLSHPIDWKGSRSDLPWAAAARDARGRDVVLVDGVGVFRAQRVRGGLPPRRREGPSSRSASADAGASFRAAWGALTALNTRSHSRPPLRSSPPLRHDTRALAAHRAFEGLHVLGYRHRAQVIQIRRCVPRAAPIGARGAVAGGARPGGTQSIPCAERVRKEVGGAAEVLARCPRGSSPPRYAAPRDSRGGRDAFSYVSRSSSPHPAARVAVPRSSASRPFRSAW